MTSDAAEQRRPETAADEARPEAGAERTLRDAGGDQVGSEADAGQREPETGAEPPRPRTSLLLKALVAPGGPERLTVGELLGGMGARGMGLILILFGAPCMLPVPPPIPLVCALAVLAVAISLIAGRGEPWVPAWLARRTVPRLALAGVVRRILPPMERLERLCRPRLMFMTAPGAKRAFGLLLAVLAVVVTLPIPIFGNFGPGLAIVVTGVGLSERDGAVMVGALGVSGFALAYTVGMAWAVAEAAAWAF